MKSNTSNIENSRLDIEEYSQNRLGDPIVPEQYWRDAGHIPEIAPSIVESQKKEYSVNGKVCYVYPSILSFTESQIVYGVISYYKSVPLTNISGSEAYNCINKTDSYTDNLLQYMIGPQFGKTYLYKLYADGVELPFGKGEPEFDTTLGLVKFTNKEFFEEFKTAELTIDFYKYIGRIGLTGILPLPFPDNIIHFKSSSNNSATASFIVKGGTYDTKYILPGPKSSYIKTSNNTYTVMLEENFQEKVTEDGLIIDGGEW
jgi:hypothetical protein